MARNEDIWYAVNVTRTIVEPKQTLETFGATSINYHIISELMDSVNQVRVRTGVIHSERPQIITPNQFAQQLLEGFGERAQDYANWLTDHGDMVQILKYGLQLRKEHNSSEVLNESLESVVEKVKDSVLANDKSFDVVLIGADELWEVSLLKFARDYIERSASNNINDLHQFSLESGLEQDREIEMAFQKAVNDKAYIDELASILKAYGLYDKYEDRFYAIVNMHA